MKLIFCLDTERGVSFFGKRQSRDKHLCDDIIADCADSVLEMSEYSAKIFAPHSVSVQKTPTMSDGSTYFCEITDPKEYVRYADEVVIYNWNRHYPSDIKFDADMGELGFALVSKSDLVGHSHEKITKETYKRV